MTKKQFKYDMQRGLGSCILALKESKDLEKYQDIIIWGCKHDLAYDTQCEGTRSYYLYQMIQFFKDLKPFYEAVASGFDKCISREGWEFSQHVELLAFMAGGGYEPAVRKLDEGYFYLLNFLMCHRNHHRKERENLESVCLAFISCSYNNVELIKKKYIDIVNDLGRLFATKPKQYSFSHFEINSEEDAKQLFYLCNTNYYNVLKKKYDDETVKKFDEYAPREKLTEWVLEKCRGILNQIIDGDTDQLYDKLCIVSGRCDYWVSANDDDLSQLYTKACKQLFEQNIEVPLKGINSYLGLFTRRFNPLHVKELLDMTETYLKVNFAKEYEKPELNSPEKRFKELSAKLRGAIEELTPIENIHGFKYVLTDKSRLSAIVDYYSKKYNDEEAVKDVLACLNCAYGVENEEVFVTALSDEADSIGNSDYSRYEFIAILLKNNTIVEFHCNRSSTDGSLQRGYRSIDDFSQILMDAVYFYRNKPERDAFCQEYSNTHNGASIRDLKYAAHDELYATFAASYGEEMERIGDNPLADILKELINICEKKAHEYNIENTIIEKPATWEEIEKWEQENGIKLPKSYKDFLLFANGVQFFSSSEQIFGLDEIGRDDEYLEDDYISIGEIIGDGTMLCLSKTTQKAYVADHGEYNEKGDFEELLKYFLEFLW